MDPQQPADGRLGIKDSRDEALTYLRTLTKGFVAESMLATFVDSANEMVEFFELNAGSR